MFENIYMIVPKKNVHHSILYYEDLIISHFLLSD